MGIWGILFVHGVRSDWLIEALSFWSVEVEVRGPMQGWSGMLHK